MPKLGDTNPFVPTDANTCVGAEALAYGAFPVVYDAAALLAESEATDIWFALHVDIVDGDARTTYIVGPGGGSSSAATTTSSTTTSSTTTSSTTTSSTTPTTSTTSTTAQQFAATTTVVDSIATAADVLAAEDDATEVLGVTLEAETLPRTGSPITWLFVTGVVLLALGFGLLVAGRRPAVLES